MARKITSIRPLLEKARACKVEHVVGPIYRVTSSTSGEVYTVDIHTFACTDPRQEWIGPDNNFINACSHVQAALIYKWLQENYWLVARAEPEDVANLKRKVVEMVRPGADIPGGDGVKFTARKIRPELAQRHLKEMGEIV